MDKTVIVSPFYIEARNEIVKPGYFVATSQYFVDCWMPRLGPVATCMVLCLRRRGYLNQRTGERRDRCVIPQKSIAEACACSVATVRREIASNEALKAFLTVEPQYERNGNGHVRQLENVYHIAMDDPLVPEDVPRLEALIKEREVQSRSREAGKKTIRNVVAQIERVGEDVVAQFETTSLQIERLKPLSLNLSEQDSLPESHKDTFNNNNTPSSVPEDLVVALCASGMSRTVAKSLASSTDRQVIECQLEMLAYRGAQDPAAVLVKAIRENWAAPAAYVREQSEKAQEARKRERAAEAARKKGTREKEEEALSRQIAACWDALEASQREQIEGEAHAILRQRNAVLAARLAQNPQSRLGLSALESIRRGLLVERMGLRAR